MCAHIWLRFLRLIRRSYNFEEKFCWLELPVLRRASTSCECDAQAPFDLRYVFGSGALSSKLVVDFLVGLAGIADTSSHVAAARPLDDDAKSDTIFAIERNLLICNICKIAIDGPYNFASGMCVIASVPSRSNRLTFGGGADVCLLKSKRTSRKLTRCRYPNPAVFQ
jgi:hypothetical protein